MPRTHQSNNIKGVQGYLEKDGFLMSTQVKSEGNDFTCLFSLSYRCATAKIQLNCI